MKKQIYIFAALVMLAIIILFAATIQITRRNNLLEAENAVVQSAQTFAWVFGVYTEDLTIVQFWGGTRITIVSPNGQLLADTFRGATQENYLNRPEIIAAINGTPTIYRRFSETWQADAIYYAMQISTRYSGSVIVRASIPVEGVNAYLRQSLPLLFLLLFLVAGATVLLTRNMANRVLLPFATIEQRLRKLSEQPPAAAQPPYPELAQITKEIDELAIFMHSNINALENEKNKLAYILDNIGDGLFVVDENTYTTLINSAALDIFKVTSGFAGTKLSYLTGDNSLISAVADSIENSKNSLLEFTIDGKIYLCSIKRLPDTTLTMVVLTNITQNHESAKQREEFFANASHELKTPLTAIRGFNELTTLHNKDEALGKYIEGISRETNRMMLLITDMLRISELENRQLVETEDVSIAKVISEVQNALSTAIEERAIKFKTSGDATVKCKPEHMYEIIKNLVENAVRYNNHGGKVSIKVETGKKHTRLTVKDTGIGISPAEHTKIFERFYRVEKSRAVTSGGTGLGLAIVKHTCALYGWKLSLRSKLGVGTETEILIGIDK